jgi:hypothetical protein
MIMEETDESHKGITIDYKKISSYALQVNNEKIKKSNYKFLALGNPQ